MDWVGLVDLRQSHYAEIIKIRKKNFAHMHKKLGKLNEMKIEVSDDVPMVYPFLIKTSGLREKLIKNKIYIPHWWKEVLSNVAEDSYENYLSNNLLQLPIDHRYSAKDLDFIMDLILKNL